MHPLEHLAGQGGRPPAIRSIATVLALVLWYYRGCERQTALCYTFRLLPTTLSRYLKRGEAVLAVTLAQVPQAGIYWPTLQQQVDWAARVQQLFPLVQGRWGLVDGKNYRVMKPGNRAEERRHFNNWLRCPLVTNLFVFGIDGCLAWAKVNCFGAVNDAYMGYDLFLQLLDPTVNAPGHGLAADTAFPTTGVMSGHIVSPLKEGELAALHLEPVLEALVAEASREITFFRQTAEWGVGSPQKAFERFQEKHTWNKARRAQRLANIIQLYNFRVRTTGISQIRTVFDSAQNM
jgi:hypothetical protein